MDRRTFLTVAAAALVAAPHLARAQRAPGIAHLAIVSTSHPVEAIAEGGLPAWDALLAELRQIGWIEGSNLAIARWSALSDRSQNARIAADVVATQPDVIFAQGGVLALAIQAATASIPIVSTMGSPVEAGIVASLARPGGNITGVTPSSGLGVHAKVVQFLHEIVPTADRFGWIGPRQQWERLGGAPQGFRMGAAQLGITLVPVFTDVPVVDASIRRAFAEMPGLNLGGLVIGSSTELRVFPQLIAELARAAQLPTISYYEQFARAGALMSYGESLVKRRRRAAHYIDRILKGANPAEMPIEQPMRFDFIVNLKTAKAIGLTLPPAIMIQATEFIE